MLMVVITKKYSLGDYNGLIMVMFISLLVIHNENVFMIRNIINILVATRTIITIIILLTILSYVKVHFP